MDDMEHEMREMIGRIHWAEDGGRVGRLDDVVAQPRELCERLASAVPRGYRLSGDSLFALLGRGVEDGAVHRHSQLILVEGERGWASAELDAPPTGLGGRRRVRRVELVWSPDTTDHVTVRRGIRALHRRVTAALKPTVDVDPDQIRTYLEWALNICPQAELRKILLRLETGPVLVIIDQRRRRPSGERRHRA